MKFFLPIMLIWCIATVNAQASEKLSGIHFFDGKVVNFLVTTQDNTPYVQSSSHLYKYNSGWLAIDGFEVTKPIKSLVVFSDKNIYLVDINGNLYYFDGSFRKIETKFSIHKIIPCCTLNLLVISTDGKVYSFKNNTFAQVKFNNYNKVVNVAKVGDSYFASNLFNDIFLINQNVASSKKLNGILYIGDIAGQTNDNVYAVGVGNCFFKFDGDKWLKYDLNPKINLNSVVFINDKPFALGEYSTIVELVKEPSRMTIKLFKENYSLISLVATEDGYFILTKSHKLLYIKNIF